MKFFLLRLLCVSRNLSESLAWNTVAMSGLVVLAATGMLDKLQKQICKTVGPSLAASLELLLIIEIFYRYYFGSCFFLFHWWFSFYSFIATCKFVLNECGVTCCPYWWHLEKSKKLLFKNISHFIYSLWTRLGQKNELHAKIGFTFFIQ